MRRSTRSKTAARAHEGDFASANPHSSLSVLENAGTTTTGGVGRKQRRMTEENDGKGGEEKEEDSLFKSLPCFGKPEPKQQSIGNMKRRHRTLGPEG